MDRFHALLLLFARREGFALDHRVFFFLEDLFLDVLVGGQRHVLLADLLAHHLPLLPHLVYNLMVLPRAVTGQAGKIGGEVEARTLLAPEGIGGTMLFASVFAPGWSDGNLQGGLQEATSKSFLLTSQYIPHSSGREGTKAKRLQGHFWHAVVLFLPKNCWLCPVKRCPQKHLEYLPRRKHSDFLWGLQ